MLSPRVSVHNEEIITVHQNIRLQVLVEEMTRTIFQSPKLERNAPAIVGLRPEIRTSSFAVSHTHLAALPWGPRVAIGRRRREPHQRRRGLGSRLRWRSGMGPLLEKRLPGTTH